MSCTKSKWRQQARPTNFIYFFLAVDLQGCCPHTRFVVPPKTTHWVAIMQRGKCTFKEKILKAAAFNASAVIIYNNSTKEDTVTMAHEGELHNWCILIKTNIALSFRFVPCTLVLSVSWLSWFFWQNSKLLPAIVILTLDAGITCRNFVQNVHVNGYL